MRNARLLTVSRSIWWGGVCPAPRLQTLLDADPLWTEWHTGVTILPCPKLRLRAVKTPYMGHIFEGLAGCENLDETSQNLTSRYVNETVVADRVNINTMC